ncbi:unnamed protein product [Chilo suppressalis]|uniref:C2H2-type domain-containing protein n=1 Tax=Chilo suppressalis TaxID=168631 RepID=A0ABN8AYU4_CHISP|nr:hypothetical protein evm_004741 [Chilo suppressalis]CAH0398628.1 unnamed protein product [Chilo suppressalis]
MKRPSNLSLLTPEEKVQYLFKNGHLVRDKFIRKAPINNGKIDKSSLPITKNSLMSKSGRIRKKRMDNLRLFDNILKTELLIEDKKKKPIQKDKGANSNNNNDDVSDHNVDWDLTLLDPCNLPTVFNDVKKTTPPRKKKAVKRSPKTSTDITRPAQSFQCNYCAKMFEAKSSLSRHIYGHLNLKPHKCPHCPKKFRYEPKVQEHIVQDHPELDDAIRNFICDICGQYFLLEKNYNEHLATHVHSDEEYKCLFCEESFSQYSILIKHEKQHLVTGRYICTICKMSYTCRDHLSLHLKGHLKIKEFMCQYCGKEFLRLNSMQRHVQVCHAGHRIKCPICKKELKGHLTEHMRTHEKKRPHKCPDCGQRFTQSTQLNVHRRSHTGARPYPCRICNHRFSHSNALMLHIRRHTGEKPFPCAMCPLKFSQLPHMKAHMRNIHGKENAYKCKKCAQFFKLKVDLENHQKNCTVGDKELSFEEKIEASIKYEEVEVESVMSLSRMRYLLALLLTMIASKDKLKYLGFNKRLIDELLLESLEAMGITPCKDESLTPIKRLRTNIEMLLKGTVPKTEMEKLTYENKSTEEILELLTDEKKSE